MKATLRPQKKPNLRWDVISVFLIVTLVTIFAVPAFAYLHGYSTALCLTFFVFMAWNGLSITAGYHRLWAHKSYEAHIVVQLLFALGGALAVQNSIRVWCSNHRRHHRYVDSPENDPYAATKGLWYSHIGWMFRDYPAAAVEAANIRDMDENPLINWQHKHYWILAFSLNIVLTALIGALLAEDGDVLAGALGGVLLLGFCRLAVCHHTTFFINSLAHAWGKQPYSEKTTAKDNAIVALLTYGEGYHNFHHTFQWDYRNGLKWYQFDPTKWLIRTLAFIKLTHNLKRTPPATIELSIAKMQLTRARAAIRQVKLPDADVWLERLEDEYNSLRSTINLWAECRQQWLELRTKDIVRQWEATELRKRLKELEAELALQKDRWLSLQMQIT